MPVYKSTAEYAAAQLRRMDWIVRHALLSRIRTRRPALYNQIIAIMSPDECLYGSDSVPVLAAHSIVILCDRPKPTQTKITKFFKLIRRRR